jgi:hypothetical protein
MSIGQSFVEVVVVVVVVIVVVEQYKKGNQYQHR